MFLTVALPIYKQADITWLALEGLCRQENVPCEWELIVCEEVDGALGTDALHEYVPRLQAAGCVRYTYIPLDQWIPLSMKWRRMAQESMPTSDWFLLQGADDYPAPDRLQFTVELAQPGVDWINSTTGAFCDLQSGDLALWHYALAKLLGFRVGLDKALATSVVRQLPVSERWGTVDHWIYEQAGRLLNRPLNVAWHTPRKLLGVYSHGRNHISDRKNGMGTTTWPYGISAFSLDELLPADIYERLMAYITQRQQVYA